MKPDWDKVTAAVRAAHGAAEGPWSAYLYDLQALARHAAHIREGLPPQCDFFYAVKANSDAPLLHALAPHVDGFEASSGGEITWLREQFPHTQLIFSGPGKLDTELALAIEQRVTVHVESLHELERLAALARAGGQRVPLLLRVNPPLAELATTTLVMGGKPTQFGIAIEHLPACLQRLRQEPLLDLRGFHFHLLSHQLDADRHVQLLSAYLQQSRQWCTQYGLHIEHINVGGGIGVNYRDPVQQFDWPRFSASLAQLLAQPERAGAPRLRFELGRYVSAFCGYYAAEVIDIKQAGGRTFAVVRGGTHQFRTPYAQGHSHPFHVLPVDRWDRPYPRPGVTDCTVTVAGQLCTPKDVLATDAPVAHVRVGDLLLFPYAGAYAWHISHHDFLRHPHPQHIYF
ncbi:type III PLP-dependent enzyme [Pseudoduganella ginsengisoli]|uniref:Siderophore biosynthesis PLP-dependent protein n=1 Tax=Pseudoduganella ginsengisoli TaxID=1462440 RepID=A0A6L6PU57_9BURK|nr:type III PLP-dependent enzyme [Pseudoduganella ginsengisoli]MTW00771.1 siderophore biosynthesis PLP-dependent protein [Pseudoduganella ginsengisoli]